LPLVHKPPPINYGKWDVTAVTDGYPDKVQTYAFWVEGGSLRIASGAKPKNYYRCRSGLWICYGTVTWHINRSIPIDEHENFYFNGQFDFLSELTWQGHFDTPTTASGTFDSEVWTTYCGICSNHGTWTAHWVGPTSSPPTGSGGSAEDYVTIEGLCERE